MLIPAPLQRIFLDTAALFAEYIQAEGILPELAKNVFGRKVNVSSQIDFGRLHGIASTGVRTTALIDGAWMTRMLNPLAELSRQRIPLVIVVYHPAMQHVASLSKAGCILYRATGLQQFVDRLMLAQVVAEKALKPAVVLWSGDSGGDPVWPAKPLLQDWFGNPDDRVPCPTEAQEMVFGKFRRRMPMWHHPDLPVLSGVHKTTRDQAYAGFAYHAFEFPKLEGLIHQTEKHWEEQTGRSQRAVQTFGARHSRHLIVTDAHWLDSDPGLSKLLEKNRIMVAVCHRMYPVELPKGSWDSVLVVEHFADGSHTGGLLSATIDFSSTRKKTWACYAEHMPAEGWEPLIKQFLSGYQGPWWIQMPVQDASKAFPKQNILSGEIQRRFPEASVQIIDWPRPVQSGSTSAVPSQMRNLINQGPPFTRTSRFFDHVASLYNSPSSPLLAEPVMAYPVVPVYSNWANQQGADDMPVFNMMHCADPEVVLDACPRGALPSTLIGVESLIATGVKMARSEGNPIASLVPLQKVWAREAVAVLDRGPVGNARQMLEPAWAQVAQKQDPEKRPGLAQEVAFVLEAIGPLPIAATQQWFYQPEKWLAGQGMLFTLAVDPKACNGCGLCALAAENSWVTMAPPNQERIQKNFDQFLNLPVAPQDALDRLMEAGVLDPLTALSLNRDQYFTFAGAPQVASALPASQSIRVFLSAGLPSLLAARLSLQKRVEAAIPKINAGIKEMLSDALPVNHLDTLMKSLSSHVDERISMDAIIEKWSKEESFKSLDRRTLERKLRLVEDLKLLRQNLKEGIHGEGRSTFTLVLDSTVGFVATYPWNPFGVSVLCAEQGNTASMAMGSAEGLVRHGLDSIRLLRRGELEAAGKYNPIIHDDELASLSHAELSNEERSWIPPVVVVGNQDWFISTECQSLLGLMAGKNNLRVLVLDNGITPMEQLPWGVGKADRQLWPLVAQGHTYLANVTTATPQRCLQDLTRAWTFDGPALVKMLTPDLSIFDIAPEKSKLLSHLALSARAFIPWSFDPDEVGPSISTGLAPFPDAMNHLLGVVEVARPGNKSLKYGFSYADWAFAQKQHAVDFNPVDETTGMLTVMEYLTVNVKERSEKRVFILRIDGEEESYYEVSERLLKACEVSLQNIRLLREWSGLFTPFPDRLKAEVKAELQREYEEEKAAFVAEYEQQRKDWEAGYLLEIREKVKEKLLQMSGM